MTTYQAGLASEPPSVKIEPIKVADMMNPELPKYLKAWGLKDGSYRNYSPGEQMVPAFLQMVKASARGPHPTVIDWGCGTGRAGYRLFQQGMDVTLVDFASNCLDDWVEARVKKGERLKFIEHDLTKKIDLRADYGICADVMEHIPEDQCEQVLENILESSLRVMFNISTTDDVFGHHHEIKETLHVNVKPYKWWLKKFADMDCIVEHSDDQPNAAIFYVTGYRTFRFNVGQVNTDKETVIEHMRENATLGLPQVTPHEEQPDREVMLLCGGPSLNDFEDEIIAQREAGMALITTNGTYNWAIERGLKPSLQMMIDAREFNKRFVDPVVDDCKYIMATQCHPEVIRSLPPDRTLLWQVSLEDEFLPVVRELWGTMHEDWHPCPGGSTVTLRALCCLNMLGLRKIHVYGFDSCMAGNEHHAYEQSENDELKVGDLRVGRGTPHDRTFKVQGWMATQAQEFLGLTKFYFQNLQLDVKGDGLIAHLINCGADATLSKQE